MLDRAKRPRVNTQNCLMRRIFGDDPAKSLISSGGMGLKQYVKQAK